MDRDIRMLLAERAIAAVINRYCHAMDSRRQQDWVNCFAPDGVFEVLLPNGETYALAQGEAELAAFFAAFPEQPGVHRHVYVSPQFDVDPDEGRAKVESYFLMLSGGGEGAGVSSFGRTSDTFVRVGEEWRIKERRLVTEAMQLAPAAGGSDAADR